MPTKRKPYKFTTQRRGAYLDGLRTGLRRGDAAKVAGVARSTVASHRKHDEDFATAEVQAEGDANEVVEAALFLAAREGNVTACQVWLYNRSPERWSDQRKTAVTAMQDSPEEMARKIRASIREMEAATTGTA